MLDFNGQYSMNTPMLIGLKLSYPNFAIYRAALEKVYTNPQADITQDVEKLFARLPEKFVDTIEEDIIQYMELSGYDQDEIEQARSEGRIEVTVEHIRTVIKEQADTLRVERLSPMHFESLCEMVMPFPIIMRNRLETIASAIPADLQFERVTVSELASALRLKQKHILVTNFTWDNAATLQATLDEAMAQGDGMLNDTLALIPFKGNIPAPLINRGVFLSFDFEGDDAFAAVADTTYHPDMAYL